MRQKKIISYQEMEARIEYLESLVVRLFEFVQDHSESVLELSEFLRRNDDENRDTASVK